MIGAFKQTTSRFAIAAAAGLFTGGIALTPVQAASLGGDCCADLEERVAELEATTVRKGNRKVSVKLSGHVHRAILFWDDGEENDVYIVDSETSNTRWRITGSATISPGRTVGFRIENEQFIRDNSSKVNQANGGKPADTNDARYQDIWFKDQTLGKFSVGHGDTASNGTSEVDLSGTGIANYSGLADVGGAFEFRTSTGALSGITLGSAYSSNDGLSRDSRIRYDTPTLAGFTISTSYGQDDKVDGALRFKKEWNSVRCAWAGGIAHDTNEENDDKWIYSTSGSCIHTPSGLNLTIAYSETDEGTSDVDTQFFYIKAGISRRWNSHGKTSISVAYANNQDRVASVGNLIDDELDSVSVAILQKIDSAALELYAVYTHHDYDDNTATSYQELDFFTLGARIKF